MINKRVLIIGGDSAIGAAIKGNFKKKKIEVITTTRNREKVDPNNIYLNLNEQIEFWEIPKKGITTAIICAAITSIKMCQDNPSQSYQVNYLSAVNLAKKLAAEGVYVVLLSTNLVFDGVSPLQNETQHLLPKTIYGLHKLMAEQVLINLPYDNIAILRLTKVLGERFDLFEIWIKELKLGKTINPISDMSFAPITMGLVVDAVYKLIYLQLPGVFQLSAISDITYAEAACCIAKYYGFQMDQISPKTANECGVNNFTKNSSMDFKRATEDLNLEMTTGQSAIKKYLDLRGETSWLA